MPSPPKQSRSRRTLERIVRASLEILDAEGPDGLTVQAVVTRADSSVGSFYARFRGKDELLDYLGERVWQEALERWDDALVSRNWSELTLEGLVEGACGLLASAARHRATYLMALDRAPGGRDDGYQAFRRHLVGGIGELLLRRSPEIDHPSPALAIRIGLHSVIGLIDAESNVRGEPIPSETLVAEASALLLRYLATSSSPAVTDPDQVDFFDIWG